MLVDAAHKACARRPNVKFLDYADTGEAALVDAGGFWPRWSKPMNKVINVFICLTQIGSNAVYALFIAQNLQPIFEHYGGDFFKNLNYRVYIAMVLPFMLAMCSIRNLRYLSPFSILANIIQFVGLGIIFYYIFSTDLPPSDVLAQVTLLLMSLAVFFSCALQFYVL